MKRFNKILRRMKYGKTIFLTHLFNKVAKQVQTTANGAYCSR